VARHFRQVLFKDVQVQQQRGRREVLERHPAY
jgi:hypothetical protein